MTRIDRNHRIAKIFSAALERAPEERQLFVRESSGDDDDIYAAVMSLLRADESPHHVLVALGQSSPPLSPGDPTRSVHLSSQLSTGHVLGKRYRIGRLLGRGGMGEVWHATDLKLRVDVALKSLRRDRFPGEHALELIRREVRAARQVVSSNVCRIFDLVDSDGDELVSMEYIDGTTLYEVLRERDSLTVSDAMEIAAQFLAGLEAIHEAGLVHRDVKPENIMITRSGRVVLMDFGLAKPSAEGGTMAGTMGYMAPEQLADGPIDARADIFAAGVVLTEMITAGAMTDPDSRETIQRRIHQDPPHVPEGPWKSILLRAVARDPASRFSSALELSRALEDVTLRVEGAEDLRPYPGLASFTEEEASFFFGREVEVETVWKKLSSSHLLGLIGPSGAGKSSFIRAGLLPARPSGWRHIMCHPGDAPLRSLARALVPELSTDNEAMRQILEFDDLDVAVSLFSRWRSRSHEALLILDQFEELFTLNGSEMRAKVAKLIARLSLEADVRVVLSMRDDFLMYCYDHDELAPIFSEMTPLKPPQGVALRRALVQPAFLCGFRFEDDRLVDEMLSEVARERGALPLLAFAMETLWDHRDRELGLLTRTAYEEMGGVSGALAQHAEATLEQIGSSRLGIVRELLRNLVTAQMTRATREVEELLSVFPEDQRPAAREVLGQLINARLLTSFEVEVGEREDSDPGTRVEIIHESLLTAWPRLVRWQTQDTGAAQIRDQLRQAARIWEERGRRDELLWSGSALKEFQLWRERYPGGLSTSEEAFARAMNELATRRKRRRRVVIGVVSALLLGVAIVVGTLWRQGENAKWEAAARQSSDLVGLGQRMLDRNPTLALAHAIAAIEVVDSPEGRRLAMEALWRGPTYFIPPETRQLPETAAPIRVAFSFDGQYLAVSYGEFSPSILEFIILRRDGEPTIALGPEQGHETGVFNFDFASDANLLMVYGIGSTHHEMEIWSIPEARLVQTLGERVKGGIPGWPMYISSEHIIAVAQEGDSIYSWSYPLDGSEHHPLVEFEYSGRVLDFHPSGEWVTYAKGKELFARRTSGPASEPRLIGSHPDNIRGQPSFDARGAMVATIDQSNEMRVWIWDSADATPHRILKGTAEIRRIQLDPTGRRVCGYTEAIPNVWSLDAPPIADPVRLLGLETALFAHDFSSDGQWVVATGNMENERPVVALWALDAHAYPSVFHGRQTEMTFVGFAPDGQSLIGASWEGVIERWGLRGESSVVSAGQPEVYEIGVWAAELFASGDRLLYHDGQKTHVLDLASGDVETIPLELNNLFAIGASPDGRMVAAGCGMHGYLTVIRTWDMESREMRELDSGELDFYLDIAFLPDGRLLSSSNYGLRLWNLEDGSPETLLRGAMGRMDVTADGRHVLVVDARDRPDWLANMEGRGVPLLLDLETRQQRRLISHGDRVTSVALDPNGRYLVTGDNAGVVRVGPTTGEEPHILLGHEGAVKYVDVSADGQWIASGGADHTARVWAMPQGHPIHTLPTADFHALMTSLTNLRIVPDSTSASGYSLDIDDFAGWRTAPTW